MRENLYKQMSKHRFIFQALHSVQYIHVNIVLFNRNASVYLFIHLTFHLQCRSVKITILGDEGIPVQADGEAWIQLPGFIQIVHKNRAQMLTRDKVSF